VPLGTYGLIEFVMRTAGTLRDGIAGLCRYGGLINGMTNFEVVERGAEIAFGFAVPGERAATGLHLNEYTLHYMLRTITLFSAGRPAVNAIELAHTRRDMRTLEAQLGTTPVRFGASACRIWLPRRALDNTSPLSDPGLHGFLAQQLDASFAAEASDDAVRAVRDTLATRLGTATLGVREVARQLAVSERTMQRRLRSAGTSFREVVDLVRQERARQLMLVESLSIADISTRLGYETPVVFARAFRRWTGTSPRQHRKRQLVGP
jgi:AraC-like DNA-binding protein